jgi:hypothetical protein
MQPPLWRGPLDAATAVAGPLDAATAVGGAQSREMVGLSGFEPLTSRLSAVRSSQLSYRPVDAARQLSAFWILRVAKEQNGRPKAAAW